MRALIIDATAKQKLSSIVAYAKQNPVTIDLMQRIASGIAQPVGDDINRIAFLQEGFKVVFSIEQHLSGWFMHFSVSIDSPEKLPSPASVAALANHFAMPPSDECHKWIEQVEPGWSAINVLAPVQSDIAMYVIYRHPTDYPDKYVMRKLTITYSGIIKDKNCIVGETLEEVRSKVPPNLYNIGRGPLDEEQIVETWM
jgi:hypothetical protein